MRMLASLQIYLFVASAHCSELKLLAWLLWLSGGLAHKQLAHGEFTNAAAHSSAHKSLTYNKKRCLLGRNECGPGAALPKILIKPLAGVERMQTAGLRPLLVHAEVV